jgi:hemolysin-activating ACP:hemolysin acyltransferase
VLPASNGDADLADGKQRVIVRMNQSNIAFVNKSLRHLGVLRATGPTDGEAFPPGWFDLADHAYRDLGAMMFLSALSPYHRQRSLPQALAQIETPLRLGQYKLFRAGGYPRAFVTWAGLTRDAEYRFAVDHLPLRPEDWNAGASKWVHDLVTPFGHVEQILQQLAANPSETRVRTLWHNRPGTRYRILEWWRKAPGEPVSMTSYGVGQFRKKLDQES